MYPKGPIAFLIILLIPSLLSAQSETAQCILAERIFTSDTSHPVAEAMVIEGSSIRYIGSADSALTLYPNARVSDYGKAFIYPGFIDAHCHFLGYAQGLNEASLFGSNSIKEAIKATQKQAKKQAKMPIALRPDSWIIGRGWDQNLWGGQFPTRADLDAAFPDVPVCLSRVDGHAVWVNSAAERLLNVDSDFQIDGGESFEGVYIDAAADYIKERIPAMNSQALQQAVKTAEQKAFAVGLTGLHEAGLEVEQTLWLQQLQESGALKIRLNVMLSANEQTFSHLAQFGQWSSERMNVHAVKFYLDGALGSRGALLKEDYCDRLQHRGLQLMNIQELGSYAYFLRDNGIQVCVHAIGDSANALVLNLFHSILQPGHDARWRVEHAQIVSPSDWHYFAGRSIIPSVQPTHATSDAPWAESRLCEDRLTGAYAYRHLLDTAGSLALGTDFPVEDLNPLNTFYSAVFRMDRQGTLGNPFVVDQALTREEALLGMTHWAAFAGFDETQVGSLAAGMQADYVVLNCNLLEAEASKIKKAKVLKTVVAGESVYQR